jgi:NitT/TauT family transport system permease protein
VDSAGSMAVHPLSLRPLASFAGRHAAALALLGWALAWEVVARLWHLTFLPPLSAVLSRLQELVASGVILENVASSLTNLAIGFSLSLVIGLGLGLLMGAYPAVDDALDIYVTALNTTPGLVFAPIFFTIFGLSHWSIVALIVLSMSIFLIINTSAAIRGVPPELIEMGKSFNATDRQLFARILLPAALPFILGTMRLSAGHGVKAMINGEMFIAAVGLGAIVVRAGGHFDVTTVLAVLFVIGTIGFAILTVLQLVEARFSSWLPSGVR